MKSSGSRILGAAAVLCVTLGLAGACGGTALVDRDGAASRAGAPSFAGSTSIAGETSVSGTSAQAGGASVAGAPSAAGTGGSSAADACTALRDSGPCDALIPSFWHDPKTGLCIPFTYGGCAGNSNRYATRAACIRACAGAASGLDSCAVDSNCVLISNTCCQACEPFDGNQVIAINGARAAAYQEPQCASSGACAPCLPVAETDQTGKYFKAACQNAHCTAIDIRETALGACTSTSDCTLRDGADCCPQCDGVGWVPVNKTADWCGGAATPCSNCASPRPSNLDTVCLGGRCQLSAPP